MKRSTANFIGYHLRPSKQVERQLLIEFLRCAAPGPVELAQYHYIGMGGTGFYDYHMVHRFLGIRQMTSLERDKKLFPRCEFNRPFSFVEVLNQTTAAFLSASKEGQRSIYWFDYDDGLNEDMTADITSLGARLLPGGFAFVTVCGAPPGALFDATADRRLEHFQQSLGDFAIGLVVADMENSAFPGTVSRILLSAFKNAFSSRVDGRFLSLFRIAYTDTVPMITVGGVLAEPDRVGDIQARVGKRLPFLMQEAPYTLGNFNFTERERALLDIAVTSSRRSSKHVNALKTLGFRDEQFEAYRQMIRFT